MRVLIYSVSAGAGHIRAAEAVLSAFRRYHPTVEVEHVDVMKLVPKAFKKAYADSYLKVVNSLPSIWGWLYAKADKIPQTSAMVSVRKFVQKLNTNEIREHAAERDPDVILTTHFLPAEIFSDLARKRRKNGSERPKLGVVITDHDVHQLWVHPNVDRYYTASEEIKFLLAERLISADLIRATGIPCDPIFGEPLDEPARQRLRKIIGLSNAPSPTLLLNAHGCGVTGGAAAASLGGVVNSLLRKGPPRTILIVCGRNATIKESLNNTIRIPPGSVVRMYDYVTNMHELMGIADVIVTKPGGLTSAECLARGLPMVLASPIPGQEERNAEMLLENGCAVLARTPGALLYKLDLLLSEPQRLARMREGCRRIAKPNAAADIASDVVQLAGRNGKKGSSMRMRAVLAEASK
ncbi:MAG TPA: glycosyltransferase [Planctomycetota bacterium]|nr:glycosyltransferase [Planctomycetota bacterium]